MRSTMPFESRNVLGGPLALCSTLPRTGFFRDGCCNTDAEAGVAPPVVLQATHEEALAIIALADLRRHAVDLH